IVVISRDSSGESAATLTTPTAEGAAEVGNEGRAMEWVEEERERGGSAFMGFLIPGLLPLFFIDRSGDALERGMRVERVAIVRWTILAFFLTPSSSSS
ncbi:hypothetical protein PMAYCL1PPCAC_20727, partial [Pristionchus mayeri]